MKNKIRFSCLIIGLLLLTAFSQVPPKKVKVACVGDSITYGSGIKNRDTQSYPAQMDSLLGEAFEVGNFGIGGATMLKKGDKPYWEQQAFTDAQAFAPDIVVIKLGTNDTKPQNWQYGDTYFTDYAAMIAAFRALPSQPEIIVCLPVPAYEVRWGINDSTLTEAVIPGLKKMCKEQKVNSLNLYKPFKNKPELFPDRIHPNAEGAQLMAKIVAKKVQKVAKKR